MTAPIEISDRLAQRLDDELVVWLTTVRSDATPGIAGLVPLGRWRSSSSTASRGRRSCATCPTTRLSP